MLITRALKVLSRQSSSCWGWQHGLLSVCQTIRSTWGLCMGHAIQFLIRQHFFCAFLLALAPVAAKAGAYEDTMYMYNYNQSSCGANGGTWGGVVCHMPTRTNASSGEFHSRYERLIDSDWDKFRKDLAGAPKNAWVYPEKEFGLPELVTHRVMQDGTEYFVSATCSKSNMFFKITIDGRHSFTYDKQSDSGRPFPLTIKTNTVTFR